MKDFFLGRHSVQALWLAASLAVANPVPASANEEHQFEILASDNAQVIQDFAAQSGLQILAPVDALEGKRLRAVSGTFSTEQALQALLGSDDNGFDFSMLFLRALIGFRN